MQLYVLNCAQFCSAYLFVGHCHVALCLCMLAYTIRLRPSIISIKIMPLIANTIQLHQTDATHGMSLYIRSLYPISQTGKRLNHSKPASYLLYRRTYAMVGSPIYPTILCSSKEDSGYARVALLQNEDDKIKYARFQANIIKPDGATVD